MGRRKRKPEQQRRAHLRWLERIRTERPEDYRLVLDRRNETARARREDPEYREAIRAAERARYHARKNRSTGPSPELLDSADIEENVTT